MRPLTAIVVEDERYPRLSLLQKLEDFRQEVEVVDSCDNYDAALQSILRHRPDILFLDIQLQGRDSIKLLDELAEIMPLPHIIFTTAYADRSYLMSAIKLSAVDYLLKPIDKGELALAVAKVTGMQNAENEYDPLSPTGKLSFRTVHGKVFFDAGDIAFVHADGNYATVITFDEQETVLDSLANLERLLPAEMFLRVDRSYIINVKRVFRLNTKRRVCIFRSTNGIILELVLSKAGIDRLLKEL